MTVHSAPHTPDPGLNAYPLPAGLRERLRQEHGWSEAYAEGAEREYRRFVYLAARSGESVTPSGVVDEVWHTHLMFTRDYWGGFQALLPGPLHHDPGTGAAGDEAHFRAQYGRTLELYARAFGEEAPAAWWPRPGRPQRRTRPASALLGRTSALLLTLVGGAIVALLGSGGVALMIVGVGLLVFFARASAGQPRQAHADGGGSCGGGSDLGGNDGGGGDSGGSSCGGGCGGGCGS